jgi:2-dehydro-3-deoxygalactonokinase
MSVAAGDFAGAFESAIGDWLAEMPSVLAAGMIGSRQGWREVPYLACPIELEALASGMAEVRTGRAVVHLVPGLSFEGRDGVPDVMRGEETQILGALDDQAGSGLFVLPGTHGKWVVVEAGRVTRFRTMMTGEVFQALRGHTILGRLMVGDADDEAAFERGVACAGPGGGGLLGQLFSVRTLGLFERLPASGLSSYLSGLLLGSEIEEATAWLGGAGSSAVTLIGSPALTTRYRRALEAKRIAAVSGPADAAAMGLHRIARAAGLLA